MCDRYEEMAQKLRERLRALEQDAEQKQAVLSQQYLLELRNRGDSYEVSEDTLAKSRAVDEAFDRIAALRARLAALQENNSAENAQKTVDNYEY